MATYRPITLGAKYHVRLRDLGPGDALRIECRVCDHVGFVAGNTLQSRFPPTFRLVSIEHHFRCKHCGERQQIGWTTVRKAMI